MIRDERTKALINNDVSALNKYKMERERVRNIEKLRFEIVEIKDLLKSLCERLSRLESK